MMVHPPGPSLAVIMKNQAAGSGHIRLYLHSEMPCHPCRIACTSHPGQMNPHRRCVSRPAKVFRSNRGASSYYSLKTCVRGVITRIVSWCIVAYDRATFIMRDCTQLMLTQRREMPRHSQPGLVTMTATSCCKQKWRSGEVWAPHGRRKYHSWRKSRTWTYPAARCFQLLIENNYVIHSYE